MNENEYYPLGANTKDAPWNKKELPEKEIKVCVSITLSKTIKIKTNDYIIEDKGIDSEGEYFEKIDYSNCDLKKAVEEQIILPHEIYRNIMANTEKSKKAYIDGKDWNVDDFEVIIE